MMLPRTLEQAIDDWFKNSPDWPYPVEGIDIDREVRAFARDGSDWPPLQVREAIRRFIETNTSTPEWDAAN